MKVSSIFAAGIAGLACALAGTAWAGPKLYSVGTTVMTINGTIATNQFQNRDPFSIELFSDANQCLRIAVTAQGTDLEATLTAPGGRTWQDDDSNGSNRPLIKAITNVRGWHVLTISHWSGASVDADFTFTVQRMSPSASGCASPTPPRITTPVATASKTENNGPAPTGGPSSR